MKISKIFFGLSMLFKNKFLSFFIKSSGSFSHFKSITKIFTSKEFKI
jgi:hypothetical protein